MSNMNQLTASSLTSTSVTSRTFHHSQRTLLATAICVVNTSMASHQVRLLVDPGSELSFVSEELVTTLQLSRQRSSLSISGIGGKESSKTRGMVQLCLGSVYSPEHVTIYAHVLRKLSTALPSVDITPEEWSHLQNLDLADPQYFISRPIDVLLGADVYGQVIKPEMITAEPTMPLAQLSTFGWLILGPVTTQKTPRIFSVHSGSVQQDMHALQELLTKFWEQEEIPTSTNLVLSAQEQECEEHYQRTHTRDKTGRYIVRVPLHSPVSLLGSSYQTAHQRLRGNLKRFSRDSIYKELYTSFMNEYESLGHMVRAPLPTLRSEDNSMYYLPHHGVLKPDSTTTKLRVVFNGSARTSSGYSVNDLMHTGANLLPNIVDVLLWIRKHKHLLSADVTKMYRQINVHKDDWNLQRVLWIDEQHNSVPYQLTTVTYGTKAAPFLAVRTMLQLAEDEGHRFPLAVPSIKFGRYVDDIFCGADSEEGLMERARQLQGLCHAGGFPLAKWHSSSSEVLAQLGSSDNRVIVKFDDCTTRILGVQWSPKEDNFSFGSPPVSKLKTLTKRSVLSEIAQLFDPLGLVSPVTIKAKMLIQELWLHKLGWDEPLPTPVSTKWLAVREDINNLSVVSIPRWFGTSEKARVQLHGFSDASQLAMAAVIYLTVELSSTRKRTSLICSKTKVAPLKRLTIPRLELSGALLLAKLVQHVKKTVGLDVEATYLWTDSQVALTWIKAHPSRWKDYVRNRVTQIQELSTDAKWMHVPGSCNPADCASRGMTSAQLTGHQLWWSGPPWLSKASDHWPRQTDITDGVSLSEARPGLSLVGTIRSQENHWDLLFRYSSLLKLFHVTAICFRVLDRLKHRKLTPSGRIVTPQDLRRAQNFWVQATQAMFFAQEIKTLANGCTLPTSHALSRLTAFLDSDGIMRVGGRLANSALTEDEKHPAILPREAHLTSLIIDDAHKKTLHGGTQLTLAYTRQLYWIIGGRAPVKTHVLRCVICARQRGIRAHQMMGQLPFCRVTPSRTFSHTGVDYAGPLTLKTWQGRGAKTHKGWICVFVCLTTSAVHLDAVTDYSTDTFIAAYQRFISRRGIPTCMYSDCGTTFIGADTTLKKLFISATKEHQTVTHALSKDGTSWIFNPPASPHMGGKWEAAVKSTKHHLRRTVGDALLTYEQTCTLLSQIEAILNSRPLEPLSDDPADVSALTPGHFLTGDSLNAMPEPSLLDISPSRLSQWQAIQQRTQHFWKTWSSQYLHQLQAISKWHHPQNVIKVGSLVLMTDERTPPTKWPLARVTALHPGADGLPRIATLKTAHTTLTRPLVKLAPLYVESTPALTSSTCEDGGRECLGTSL